MTQEITTGLVTRPGHVLAIPNYEEAVRSMQQRRDLVMTMMKSVLKEKVHYGKIPGCGDKPSLFLAGAEQLSASFNFCPRYKKVITWEGMHMKAEFVCELYSPDGIFVAEGISMCSTYESKYRYRSNAKAGEDTGQPVPKRYWDLKKSDKPEEVKKAQELLGGKGFMAKKNADNVWTIFTVAQAGEREENQDIADTWNTVIKMGAKRAFVHAVRTATGTADVFTQDIEDFAQSYGAVLDAEVIVYDVPGFDLSKEGMAPEPKPAEPKPQEPAKKKEPEAKKAPEAPKERPEPENRPDPKENTKKAEEFVDEVSPAPVKDPFGVVIPPIGTEEFKKYAGARLNAICVRFAQHYVKSVEGTTADEKMAKAGTQATAMRDTILKEMNKAGKFIGDESVEVKKMMLAEAMEAKAAALCI